MKRFIDIWHDDALNADGWGSIDKVTYTFYPNSGEYRGNIYKNGKAIGDFCAGSAQEIEQMFPHLVFNWN